MDYSEWDDGTFLEAGSLASHVLQQQLQQSESIPPPIDGQFDDYKYKDLLGKAYKQYSTLGSLMVKKDAAITFTAIGAIGISLLCINSLVVRLLFLVVATILSFDIELQIPCASILLALFVFRDHSMAVSKALLLILSFVALVYAYWADCLVNYSDVVWWMNIFIVALWAWMIFAGASDGYYSRIIEFRGGAQDDSAYDSISEFDHMSQC